MAISKDLLDILACPKCKGDIYLNDAEDGLICEQCKLFVEPQLADLYHHLPPLESTAQNCLAHSIPQILNFLSQVK